MFRHNQLQGRQLEDLSPLFGQAACHLSERRPTEGALLRYVGENLLRLRDLFQRRARMTRLPTRLFGRRLPQRTRLFGRAVTRRRLATIAAIDGQPVFQFFDSCRQLSNLCAQLLDQRDHRLWALVVDSSDLFRGQHSASLPKVSCPVRLLAHGQRG
jgi:hypothetical protein